MPTSLYALAILAGLSGPALSQTRGESVSTGSPRYFGHLFNSDIRVDGTESRPCLVRKKTGRTECRSMAEWRRLAKKIDEARVPGQERQSTP
jgi:hypothetical protein